MASWPSKNSEKKRDLKMPNSKNFSTEFLTKSTSSRSISDPLPEPELEENKPTAEQMIDALYGILMVRLDKIEEKINCQCQKK